MMSEAEYLLHGQLDIKQKDKIIQIKSVAWPYPYGEQIEWMDNNLLPHDIHLIWHHDQLPVAYLNLIKIEVTMNDVVLPAWGIGNVCSVRKGEGFGKEIMFEANRFLIQENTPGLLFCKPYLIGFYRSCHWSDLQDPRPKLPFDHPDTITMIFNYATAVHSFSYHGRSF